MYFNKIALLLLILTIIVSACKTEYGDQRNIRNFYFPVAELNDGLVYEYHALDNDTFPPVYWYYRNVRQGDDLYLVGTAYDVNLLPQQLVTESVVDNGMLLEDMYLYTTDSTGKQQQIEVEIVAGNVYPFLVKDTLGVFLYNVKWSDSPAVSTTLIKNRRFLGDTTYTYQDKTYQSVAFSVKELVEQRAEGSLELEFAGTEIYARGLGLVYYKKEIQDGFVQEYELAATYPMTTLEEKFKQKIEQAQ